MFKKTKDIDTAFQYVRLFTAVLTAGCLGVCIYAVHSSVTNSRMAQERIYILSSGKLLEAYGADRRDNIPVEARDHIQVFHQDFFSLDPDEKVITRNITRALYLADGSAKKAYDNLKESGYYASLISGNISQQVEVDSVDLNLNVYPYYFRCMAHETLVRATVRVTRNLLTEGYLRQVERSDNNPHGFLIERWTILDNRDIKTEPR